MCQILTSLSIRSNYTGIKLFNNNTITSLNSSIKLLKQHILSHSYCVDEFTSNENSEAICGHM